MDMQVIERALTDPENQPSQWGTVPINDPNFTVIEWHPIAELDRTKDDTYMVRVENVGGTSIGPGWIDKGYYADDEGIWYEGNANEDPYIGITFGRIERGPWKITAFAKWPEILPR